MGGSGGAGYSIGRDDLARIREEAERLTQQSISDAEINDYLRDQLVRLNDRDTAAVSQRLDAIADALGDSAAEFDKLQFGGSVAKHTYVDGLSDIDSLIVLKDGSLADASPSDVLDRFADALRARLGGPVKEIYAGNMAVTVKYDDGMEIQILPAVQKGDKLAIAAASGSSWKTINPQRFAQALTDVNKRQGGAAVPAIKLAKSVIAGLDEHARISGYHVEALALAAFRDYEGPRTPKAMVTRFFESAAEKVQTPVRDATGQSRHIDEGYGPAGSEERLRISATFQRVAERMAKSRTPADWTPLVGE